MGEDLACRSATSDSRLVISKGLNCEDSPAADVPAWPVFRRSPARRDALANSIERSRMSLMVLAEATASDMATTAIGLRSWCAALEMKTSFAVSVDETCPNSRFSVFTMPRASAGTFRRIAVRSSAERSRCVFQCQRSQPQARRTIRPARRRRSGRNN